MLRNTINNQITKDARRKIIMFGGRIEIIYGPMFAGKSSELQRRVRRLRYAKKKCLIINYLKDNRYSNEGYAATHDK